MTRPPRLVRASLLVLAPAAVIGLAGCRDVTEQKPAAGPADIGGTMVVATPAEAKMLLPALQTSDMDKEVTELLFDRLAEIGDDLNTVGDAGFRKVLAERWEWAPDSLSIAFHLNPRARWHDGAPVRASDVRYSVALIKDPAFGSLALPLVTNIDSA